MTASTALGEASSPSRTSDFGFVSDGSGGEEEQRAPRPQNRFDPSTVSSMIEQPPGLFVAPPGLAEQTSCILSTRAPANLAVGTHATLPDSTILCTSPPYPASGGDHLDSSKEHIAVRALLHNLMSSLPPTATAIAQTMLAGIAKKHGAVGGVQQTMESIDALRWLQTQYMFHNEQAVPFPHAGHIGGDENGQHWARTSGGVSGRGYGQLDPSMRPNWHFHSAPSYRQSMPRSHAHHIQTISGSRPNRRAVDHAARPSPTVDSAQAASTGTLRTHLRELQNIDHERILLVRKINRLGFEAPTILKCHYSHYGAVDRVLVAQSHVKSPTRPGLACLRPSGLGFVVMVSSEDAQKVLSLGEEQVVQGVTIYTYAFEHRNEGEGDEVGPTTN